jgi:4-diphosphocytidyl-2-C-methyl-D-erythritol kinase
VSTKVLARVRAFAKINRSLEILGVRADGFHELRTVFQSIALHDTLTFRADRGLFRLTCDAPDCPTDGSNLIWRAAEHAWKAAGRRGRPRDLSIHLVKRIPMQAGLGGGSSDGAAALRALGRLWGVDPDRIRAIASSLGADVPYFFEGGTVLGLERGDLLFPLVDAPPAWVVLVIPSFGVRTKDAFAWWDHDHVGADRRVPPPLDLDGDELRRGSPKRQRREGGRPGADTQVGPYDRGNDLQRLVAKRHPEIAHLVRALERAGAAQAAMTGAGSAVFGLFSNRAAAERAVPLVSRRGRTLITRTVDRAACQALAAT